LPPNTEEKASLERARAAKAEKDAMNKTEAMNALLLYVNDNPEASLADIGQQIERSKTTVSNYVQELAQNGRLERNGQGWQVLT
jgi:DNA-binding IclR family transcriptional regulator